MAIKDLIFLKQRQAPAALDYMELVFDTTKEADATNTVTLQIGGVGPGGVTVDWGDGTTQSFTTAGARSRNYATDGIKTVRIYGDLTRYGGSSFANASKLTSVTRFNGNTKSFENAFTFAVNLTALPVQLPAGVTNTRFMLHLAFSFNQDIGGWDMSSVTDVLGMFNQAIAFNNGGSDAINSWNVSAVTSMERMFYYAQAFNQNIGGWNVANVTDMNNMFYEAGAFNNGGSSTINNWNVSAVTNMDYMFKEAFAFNQNLSTWVTGLTAQPDQFSENANATWVANKATLFPFLVGGVTRINT
jgi:surface protein